MNKIAILLALVMSVTFTSCRKKSQPATAEATARLDTLPVMIMHIQKCSRLYTTEYHVRKIITHDDQLALKGKLAGHDYNVSLPFGKRKIAIPVDATVKAYIDFASFSESNVRRDSSHIEILLPDPRIVLTSTRIDHNAIKEYVALTRRNFSDEELAAYERQGRSAILSDIATTDILEQARLSAANTLIPMLQQLGYRQENIKISFSRDFNSGDIMQLIDKTSVENAKQK